jgi:hypothetical protein
MSSTGRGALFTLTVSLTVLRQFPPVVLPETSYSVVTVGFRVIVADVSGLGVKNLVLLALSLQVYEPATPPVAVSVTVCPDVTAVGDALRLILSLTTRMLCTALLLAQDAVVVSTV